jgi:hypothetical protein
LYPTELYAFLLTPLTQNAANKLWTLVTANVGWLTVPFHELLQATDYPPSRQGKIYFYG